MKLYLGKEVNLESSFKHFKWGYRDIFLISIGNEFQRTGAEAEKALLPYVCVFTGWTVERRHCDFYPTLSRELFPVAPLSWERYGDRIPYFFSCVRMCTYFTIPQNYDEGSTPLSREAFEGSGNMYVKSYPFFLIFREASEKYHISRDAVADGWSILQENSGTSNLWSGTADTGPY